MWVKSVVTSVNEKKGSNAYGKSLTPLGVSAYFICNFWGFFRFYLFTFKERGWEEEREGNISM